MNKTVIAAVVAGSLAVPATAAAHVTVQPGSVTAGSFTKIDVRVPNERDNKGTIKVDLRLPDGFYFLSYQKVPGWKARVFKKKLDKPVDLGGFEVDERYTRVVWKARKPKRDRIAPGQFQDFPLSVRVPDGAAGSQLAFRAFQTYQRGERVAWTGAPDARGARPASDAAGARVRLLLLVVGALLVSAPAALAHQGSPNFLSQVNSAPAGVKVTVLSRDDRLLLQSDGGHTVVIEGYSEEPYARIEPDGTVSVNTDSEAYYINEERDGAGAGAGRAPIPRASRAGRRSRRPGASSGTTTACTGCPRATPSRSRTRACARRCSTGRCRSRSTASRATSAARCSGRRRRARACHGR